MNKIKKQLILNNFQNNNY